MLSIPTDNKIFKIDVVENVGVGMWFNDTELPSIMLVTQTDEEAEMLLKGFEKAKLKTKIKVVKSTETILELDFNGEIRIFRKENDIE